jgi:FMN-dependent NADH-azoreductase
MNVLHVCANPRPVEESASKQLATAFIGKLLETNPDVTLNNVDLYETPPPYLSLEGFNRLCKPFMQPGYQPSAKEEKAGAYAFAQGELLRQADVLVLTLPLWGGSCPGILKSWFDQVIMPGIAFEPSAEGIKPLHQLRKVVLLVASGDVYKEGDPRDGLMPMINGIFAYIGVNDIEVAWADGQDPTLHGDSADRKQMAIEVAQEIAEDVARLP